MGAKIKPIRIYLNDVQRFRVQCFWKEYGGEQSATLGQVKDINGDAYLELTILPPEKALKMQEFLKTM